MDHGRGAGRDHAALRAHRGDVDPRWIEELGAHLLKRHRERPHWEKARAQVVAIERGTLYGLPVYADRRVHYGPIDPKLSREIFLRSALVEGEFETRAPFFAHNQRLLRRSSASSTSRAARTSWWTTS